MMKSAFSQRSQSKPETRSTPRYVALLSQSGLRIPTGKWMLWQSAAPLW